jgi:hypothetical protein
MIEEIVPYEEALALSQIGFVQSCWHAYHDLIYPGKEDKHKLETVPTLTSYMSSYAHQYINPVLAPTYSQGFRWFREKYGLAHQFQYYHIPKWTFQILEFTDIKITPNILVSETNKILTYEEAELECLKKLIKIVKEGNK